jgi:hypothetical protein
VIHFVTIDKSHAKNKDTYRYAIGELCGRRGIRICYVHFWVAGTDAPKSLPMTDEQVESEVAVWQYNGNTGFRQFLWSCKVFPNTPKDAGLFNALGALRAERVSNRA